jgi:signal recognition particle GTPase
MLVMAHKNQQFRDILRYAHKRAGLPYYGSFNTIVLTGAAGAGKTSAEAKIAVEGEDPKKVIALGPTTRQSSGLARSLGITNGATV